MDRRVLIASGLAALGATSKAFAQQPSNSLTGPATYAPEPGAPAAAPQGPAAKPTFENGTPIPGPPPAQPMSGSAKAETYSSEELVMAVSDFFGVTAEAAGAMVERIFKDNGRPTAYIAGEEGSAAITIGARYGRGLLYMKNQPKLEAFWQGPSIGWDVGGNGSRVFTLCYNLQYPEAIFRRFPGVEGTAYLIGGMGVNYQRADGITLAPIRAGVGLRLGANVGYLSYSRERRLLPF